MLTFIYYRDNLFSYTGGASMKSLIKYEKNINDLLKRYGVKFGIYKDNQFKEQFFPFDTIPRIISKDEFTYLEKGLIQRVDALNAFLKDIYSGEYKIIHDGIIPEEFIFIAKGYLPECHKIIVMVPAETIVAFLVTFQE